MSGEIRLSRIHMVSTEIKTKAISFKRVHLIVLFTIKPEHIISYKVSCASSENPPAHQRRLIRVFDVRLKVFLILATHRVPNDDSDQTARMRRLI